MPKERRTVGTIIKWSLYSAALTVVAGPFMLLLIEKTITLDRVSLIIIPHLSKIFDRVFAAEYALIIFSSSVAVIVFMVIMFLTRNTKIAVKIYANYDRIN